MWPEHHDKDVIASNGSSKSYAGSFGQAYQDDENYCQHFIEPRSALAAQLGKCEKVEGPISGVFRCRLFARARGK
jgi:hypothetical protein